MGEKAAEAYAASTTCYYDQTDLAVSFTRGEVAQLVEHRSDTPLTLVRFPSFGKGFFFFPESTFSADSLTVSVHTRVKSHALTSVCTLEIL